MILYCILACAICYLFCSVPCALLIAKAISGVDVRTVGSGNVGSTNAVRAGGAKAGVLTLLADILKAFIAIMAGSAIIAWGAFEGDASAIALGAGYGWMTSLLYLCCVLGHMFTPWLGFKGGKGIAVGFGGALAFMTPVAGGILLVFIVLAVSTRYVSLGSVCAAISLPIWAYFTMHPQAPALALIACVAVLVIWAHRANIQRLLNGTERKFSFKKDPVVSE